MKLPVVHKNYIVVYRISETVKRVEILRMWTVWNQPRATVL